MSEAAIPVVIQAPGKAAEPALVHVYGHITQAGPTVDLNICARHPPRFAREQLTPYEGYTVEVRCIYTEMDADTVPRYVYLVATVGAKACTRFLVEEDDLIEDSK